MKADLKESFPNMDPEALDYLVPSGKDDESIIRKIYTHSGENMLIYVFRKNPLFFSFEKDKKKIYPTIYALWQAPSLIPTFTTHEPVLKNIQNGADLMCPGLVIREDFDLRSIMKGDIVSIKLTSSSASVAIGYTALSGEDMIESGFRNKGVIILHFFDDQLWKSGSQEDISTYESLMSRVSSIDLEESNEEAKDNLKSEGQDDAEHKSNLVVEDDIVVDERSETEKMDDLLKYSFLTALKTSCKNPELPILTSNFYRVHMVEAAKPHDLNIKKSSYKKLSVFLNAMSSQLKIISVAELQKGVESITSIDFENRELRFHKVERPQIKEVETLSISNKQFNPPDIEELHLVSAAVLKLFRPHQKKSIFSKPQVREFLKEYVNREQLASGPFIKLDPILAETVLNRDENNIMEMRWEEVMDRILKRMSHGYSINGEMKSGTLPPIEMKTVTRSGNKKVTLVYNLDLYGIDPSEVAHKCQVGVAASTAVDLKPPNRKSGSEVLIQGNQIAYVTKLLTEEYKINKKHLSGTEKAIKPKKKK